MKTLHHNPMLNLVLTGVLNVASWVFALLPDLAAQSDAFLSVLVKIGSLVATYFTIRLAILNYRDKKSKK